MSRAAMTEMIPALIAKMGDAGRHVFRGRDERRLVHGEAGERLLGTTDTCFGRKR